jgi:hypothetical protein
MARVAKPGCFLAFVFIFFNLYLLRQHLLAAPIGESAREIPHPSPSPRMLENQQLRGKTEKEPNGSTSYGQNLESQGVTQWRLT